MKRDDWKLLWGCAAAFGFPFGWWQQSIAAGVWMTTLTTVALYGFGLVLGGGRE